jgi:hypothetical protein
MAWRAAMFDRAFASGPSSGAPAVQEFLIAMIAGNYRTRSEVI